MAVTTKSDVFNPEILEDAIRLGLPGMKALAGSPAAVMNDSMPSQKGGSTITVPYFSNMGELDDLVGDDAELTPTKLSMDSETGTVTHSGKAFEITEWAQMQAAFADPYGEGSRQIVDMVEYRADQGLVTAAITGLPATMKKDVYSASVPRKIDWDLIVDGKMLFGDEQDDIVLLIMHSKTYGDVQKVKSADGVPLFQPPKDGGPATFCGIPIRVSDRVRPDHSVVVTTAAVAPPAVTFTGTPKGIYRVRLEITTRGAVATAVFRYSLDDGTTWASGIVTAAAVVLGTSGLTANFAAGTYEADNVFTSTPRFVTLLVKKGALVFWYNGKPEVQTFKDVKKDNRLAAIHVYWVAYRYRNLPGKTKGGVVAVYHNCSLT